MKTRMWLVEVCILAMLASCSTALPTPPAPIVDINLDPLLVIDGDLPERYQYQGQQIKPFFPSTIDYLPEPVNIASRSFRINNYESDGITIALYEDEIRANSALSSLIDAEILKLPVENFPGAFMLIRYPKGGVTLVRLGFVRCNALVYIEIIDTETYTNVIDTTVAYGLRVNKRLESTICK